VFVITNFMLTAAVGAGILVFACFLLHIFVDFK
jgi:hypothetical protein